MAKGDIYSAEEGGRHGTRQFQVASSAGAPAINAGEPVLKALGQQYAVTCATSKPVVGTDYILGISTGAAGSNGTSTDTTTVAGVVEVKPVDPADVYYIAPLSPTTYFGTGYPTTPSQTTYNALVGARVTFNKSAAGNTGTYTLNASDGATNGCVVQDMALINQPSKVAFLFRAAVSTFN
jgi:hypothetical protein